MDLGVVAVLGTHTHALAGKAKVRADHAGKAANEKDTEDADPLRPVGQESVNQGDRYEEEDSGSKNP
ncbi:hypothetical protein FQZ97_1175280 [compost metagenome]